MSVLQEMPLYSQSLLRQSSKPCQLIIICMECRTLIVREGEPLEIDSLSELGIFGLYLRQGDKLLMNKEGGHLVRTKVNALPAKS